LQPRQRARSTSSSTAFVVPAETCGHSRRARAAARGRALRRRLRESGGRAGVSGARDRTRRSRPTATRSTA